VGLLWLRLLFIGLLGRVRKFGWGHGVRMVSVHEVVRGRLVGERDNEEKEGRKEER
jgi:hypothetical protein